MGAMSIKTTILAIFTVIFIVIPVSALPTTINIEYKMSSWMVQPTKEQRGYCQQMVNMIQKIDKVHLISSVICDFRGDKYVNITRQCGFAWLHGKQISLIMNSRQCNLAQFTLHELGHKACYAKNYDKSENCADDYWPSGITKWSGAWNNTIQEWAWSIS
jgi:hypothetical protein